ncbi:3260_t:CDS:2 [Entrophospora sp. SA101]|nr:3260_t:CDS:2 [Entrophospora sp. SA101]
MFLNFDGVFTELIRAFEVKDVQVEEVWSLDNQTLEDLKYLPVYGLIFLFKWQGGNDSSQLHPEADLSLDENVYFAKQVINNACATQAILSILLNCPGIDLGPELQKFKDFTKDFDSQSKGFAITNSDLIRTVHNSFANSEPFFLENQPSTSDKDDIFHFISYVPVNGALYELDGLSTGPVNLGPCTENDWLEKVRPVIQERMSNYASAEVKFNLMALIKNRETIYTDHIRSIDIAITIAANHNNNDNTEEILRLNQEKEVYLQKLEAEKYKFKRYERENALRKHNFIPLIYNILRTLADHDQLVPRIDYAKKEMDRKVKEHAEKMKNEKQEKQSSS